MSQPHIPIEGEVDADIERLRAVHDALAAQMRASYNRHVPFNELIRDRWERGAALGFGQGSNIYDSTVVIGDVKVGRHCWVGPFCYIDGVGGLTIGDNVTIGLGTSIFTHSTVMRDLSAGRLPMETKPTVIGDRVFMSPQCMVEMGVTIGEGSVLMAQTVVKRDVPPNTIMFGNPARKVGTVGFDQEGLPRLRFTRQGMSLLLPPDED